MQLMVSKSDDVEDGTIIQMHSNSSMLYDMIIIRKSIKPSKTGNCTNFDDALTESEGILQFSWKRSQQTPEQTDEHNDRNVILAEQLLIQHDLDNPNLLRDNILYYVAGYIVKALLVRIHCHSCKSELLLDPNDCHALKLTVYPLYARFVAFKQKGGLYLPMELLMSWWEPRKGMYTCKHTHTHTHTLTYGVLGAGLPVAHPDYDRKPIKNNLQNYKIIVNLYKGCSKTNSGFLPTNSSTNNWQKIIKNWFHKWTYNTFKFEIKT